MLDLKWIRENLDLANAGIKHKNIDYDLNTLLEKDDRRKQLLAEVEALRSSLNTVNKEIGDKKRKGDNAESLILQMKDVSKNIKDIESALDPLNSDIEQTLLTLPNIPHHSVPIGGQPENKTVRTWGNHPEFQFKPKTHVEIAEHLDIVDFKRGSKLTGSGFLLFKGRGALLERALINYFLDSHVLENGFLEVSPPFLVNRRAMTGTGQLPKLEADMYRLQDEDYFLIPTAEVPVTNIFQNEILEAAQLPSKMVAYTPCFRREAGSYGSDTKGMVRIHQFDKVEMVAWSLPENSYTMLETLTGYAEKLLQALKLPYRVLMLASGDMSFAAAKAYDLEIFSAGLNRFLEVSSVSNFEDFQSRRANIRFRRSPGSKPEFVHTLNGSGLALPRIVVGILENYQNDDGSVTVPEVLRPYMRGLDCLKAE